jgi:hypothetical protein
MRREFDLPVEDREYIESLEGQGISWETIQESNNKWLLIHNWPVPSGYDRELVSVAFSIPNTYPDAQIDMAYFYPLLELKSKLPIPQTQTRTKIGGQEWQRWSRHRTGQNPWRPGVDNISTHLTQVRHWLEREISKG